MKSDNLRILQQNGFNVPPFVVLNAPYEIDLSFSNSDIFAVRSSFSAEDGEQHSFAGQFYTQLNVKRENIEKAVEKVAKSAVNSTNYTSAHSLENSGDMQVIVQDMIKSDYSGVIFTANPQGLLNEAVLIVGAGTGDLVVEDKTPVTTYYFNKQDKVYYSEEKENSPQLSEEMLSKIFEKAEKIEKLFGFYADIEFCIKNDEIYFLQVRRVTTLSDENKIILDSSNIQESYPGVTLPCSQSFAGDVYYNAFSSCVKILTKNHSILNNAQDILRNMVKCANGRMYYQISNWYHLLNILPFAGKIIPIWQEMLGVAQKDVPKNMELKPKFTVKFIISVRFLYYMVVTPKKMEILNNYFKLVYKKYKTQLNLTADSEQLLNLYKEMLENIGAKWGITLINDMYAFIYTSIAKKRHGQKLNNISKLESLRPVLEMKKLAKLASTHGFESDMYKNAAGEYLDKYGDRGLEELKLETKTMNTNPEMLDDYIKNNDFALFSELSINGSKADEFFESEDFTREKSGQGYINNANKSDSYIVRCAKKGIFNREMSRMNRTRLYGLARNIFGQIGENFEKAGVINNERDIFYLYIEEIEQCICGKFDKSAKEVIERRKLIYEEYTKLPTYTRLVYQKKVFDKVPKNAKTLRLSSEKGALYGTPSSGGIVRGEVLLVDKPSLNLNTSGKILVADITDPGWVFLIKNAKGVIAQRGSILSHTAIITRELKKPSVVGASGAMGALKTGDVVELNGDNGTVTIIETVKNK